jgi:hypothetical protein
VSKTTIPADDRKKVLTQQQLVEKPITIYAAEDGPDLRVFSSDDEEGDGFPFRADDMWCLPAGTSYAETAGTADGLHLETETSSKTDVYILIGVCVEQNPRRKQKVDVDAQSASVLTTDVEQIGGAAQSAVDVAAAIDALEDALTSVGADALGVESASALDVSAAEVDVDLATQSLASIAVQENNPLDVSGATVDVQEASPLDVSGATVGIESNDDGGDQTTSTSTNVSVTNSDGATAIVADTSGSATLTVEVSVDGGSNWTTYTVSIGGSEGHIEEVHGFTEVRASVDQNLNRLAIASKGVGG